MNNGLMMLFDTSFYEKNFCVVRVHTMGCPVSLSAKWEISNP